MFSRTVEIGADFDLNNVCGGDGTLFVRDGVGHAARGTAVECDGQAVRPLLESIQSEGGMPKVYQDDAAGRY